MAPPSFAKGCPVQTPQPRHSLFVPWTPTPPRAAGRSAHWPERRTFSTFAGVSVDTDRPPPWWGCFSARRASVPSVPPYDGDAIPPRFGSVDSNPSTAVRPSCDLVFTTPRNFHSLQALPLQRSCFKPHRQGPPPSPADPLLPLGPLQSLVQHHVASPSQGPGTLSEGRNSIVDTLLQVEPILPAQPSPRAPPFV